MQAVRTLAALAVAILATACANPGAPHDATHAAAPPSAAAVTAGSAQPVDPRLKAMQEMHLRMRNASTPAERQALMDDHLRALQGGLAMLNEMHARHAGHGAGGMGAGMGMGMGQGSGGPADRTRHRMMMADHMTTMRMMIEMMADRMPVSPVPAPVSR